MVHNPVHFPKAVKLWWAGRTLDFIRQGRLDLSTVTMVVLDEADEMLKNGIQRRFEAILDETPDEKQVLLFSATMPTLHERTMVDPHRIAVAGRNQANRNVTHKYCVIHPADRFERAAALGGRTSEYGRDYLLPNPSGNHGNLWVSVKKATQWIF